MEWFLAYRFLVSDEYICCDWVRLCLNVLLSGGLICQLPHCPGSRKI